MLKISTFLTAWLLVAICFFKGTVFAQEEVAGRMIEITVMVQSDESDWRKCAAKEVNEKFEEIVISRYVSFSKEFGVPEGIAKAAPLRLVNWDQMQKYVYSVFDEKNKKMYCTLWVSRKILLQYLEENVDPMSKYIQIHLLEQEAGGSRGRNKKGKRGLGIDHYLSPPTDLKGRQFEWYP